MKGARAVQGGEGGSFSNEGKLRKYVNRPALKKNTKRSFSGSKDIITERNLEF